MSITEGTQPVVKTWTGAWTTAQTTAAFVPESGALLVALLAADSSAVNSGQTGSITDSLSGSWTLLKRQNQQDGVVGGLEEVWCRDSPGVSLTVSATGSANTANGGQLVIRTLIGAKPAAQQNGATGSAFLNTGAVQCSVAAGTGNKIYGAAHNWTNSTAMTDAGNTSDINQFSDATNGDVWAAFKSTSDTAGTATYGYSTSTQGGVAAVEILALPFAPIPVTFNPGATWKRRYRHRQILPPFVPAASTPISLTDTVTIDDSGFSVAAAVSLTDTVAITDALTVTVAVSLSDNVTITDALSVANALTLTDSVAITDALSVAGAIPLTDTVALTDGLTIAAAVPLTDSISITDVLGIAAAVPLTDSISITDVLNVSTGSNPSLTDVITISDSLSVVVTLALADTVSIDDEIDSGHGTNLPLVIYILGPDAPFVTTLTSDAQLRHFITQRAWNALNINSVPATVQVGKTYDVFVNTLQPPNQYFLGTLRVVS